MLLAACRRGAAALGYRRVVTYTLASEPGTSLRAAGWRNGCPKCPVTVVADITRGPIADIEDNTAVVFLSCVFEYVQDLDAALREVARIAGSADNVFIVTVQPWTLTARLYPGARWRGTVQASGGGQGVDMKPVSLEEKLAATGLLGLALAAAFWPQGGRR